MSTGFEWHSPGGGVYWKQFKEKAGSLGQMGITAVWLPPPTKASSQDGNGYDIVSSWAETRAAGFSFGSDGKVCLQYDLWDLGEFDIKGGKATKWGTKQEFLDLVKELKAQGVVTYIDAVLNHRAGADFKEPFNVIEVAEDDRNKGERA